MDSPENSAAMSPEEFRQTLDRIGLSQRGVARILEINPRTVSRYAKGDLVVTTVICWALRGLEAEADTAGLEVV